MSTAAERARPRIETDSPQDKDKLSAQFKSSLVLIQSRPLNPDTIDTYAQDALSDLVSLSASITQTYQEQPDSSFGFGKELEDKAFGYFGLKSIDGVLAYVAAKDAEIKQIGDIVENAQSTGQVIVPPDSQEPLTGTGDGEFKKKSVISRTKTVLFILANDFGVDLNNPDDFSIKTGVLTDTMMRGLSYYQISVPSLGRTILCCDEEGNVSYVFDNKVLEEHGITSDDLSTLTKNDINDLLDSDAKMGKRLVYTSKFVPRMIGLMTEIQSEINITDPQSMYLIPKAPVGVLTVKGLAKLYGVDFGTVARVIAELEGSIGDVQMYKFATKQTVGYTPHQQVLIKQRLEEGGFFSKSIPEGVTSILGIAKKLGLSHPVVSNAARQLADELGPVQYYRFGANLAVGFSTEQQEKIIKFLEKNRFLNLPIPEDVLSADGIAKDFQIDRGAVQASIKRLGESLGKVDLYRFGARRVSGYNQAQRKMIYDDLELRGVFAPKAPEGVLSPSALAEKLNTSKKTLAKVVARLGDLIGPVNKYKFHTVTADGYLPEQVKLIEKDFRERGLIAA